MKQFRSIARMPKRAGKKDVRLTTWPENLEPLQGFQQQTITRSKWLVDCGRLLPTSKPKR